MPPLSSAASTSVQVALRIRPATTQDSTLIPARFQRSVIHATGPTIVTVDASSSSAPSAAGQTTTTPATVSTVAKKQTFTFDQVHPPATTQHALFTSTAEPLISRFVDGFNCTILAYGQTSSGKTFTMTGADLEADPSDPTNGMGIIPRAVSTIFSRTRQLKQERGGAWTYNIKASFIEIYNEDLIDLLSLDDTTGVRREVQIREDKDGHIIWGGLRELNVKNPNEVMNLLRKGSSIRRTNETDMNAQSSRSHAIFSLTLTQKKFKGSGPPPRSSSPLPPGGRSPSRLARPGSMYSGTASSARISSPTLGRPGTPSFISAISRGGGPMRPSSALGLHPSDARNPDDEPGEWVTIVSKFHFVDLAGSERLKRTAAAGERIKEGISINSGLLALGNVISALGDPSRAKSHTASHVPYRDSKLTRLLQDSLGGNAHTLMIACVSPAEWNVGETVNTLKYANRARNIKNRAVVNEKEDGWDDVEWLQGTVTRLRKELKVIKEGGPIGTSYAPPEVLEGAGKKVLAQMTELQNNYEDLREKFVERTEELTRLRRELGERQRGSTAGAVGGTAKYEEIVGPVIEEYEKTIGAMEAELNLNRAALRHTNEMVEEKEEELAIIAERHAATELYVEELRSRLSKLSEREASTEAYVRDLEEKIKAYDETSITSSESMTDLKREVARFKDTESHSGKYIADLEVRLARSDESILTLQQTVEKLETECDRRRDEAELLQSRLDVLKQDGESWRTDLEERERKVRELEEKMQAWERKRQDAGEERLRLGGVVGEVAQARRSLEVLGVNGTASKSTSGVSTPNKAGDALESQLVALQQTHTATLADLSAVTSKYRDALREISDLAAQIQEAKFNSPPATESPAVDALMDVPDIPPFRRRMSARTREVTETPISSPARRLFFRQAVSAESLHSRSLSQSQLQSLSLSQELSSARSRKASISSHGADSTLSHSPSGSHSSLGFHSVTNGRPALTITVPGPERSVVSLEKEIMRLQEVLRERETEISVLEESLRVQIITPPSGPPDEDKAPTTNGDVHASADVFLSPKTMNQFDNIRKVMENGHGHPDMVEDKGVLAPEPDESLDRLNELMLAMAQKESHHREVVDTLNDQLSQVRRQHEDLVNLSRDQAINMSTEFEALRDKYSDDLAQLELVRQHEAELLEALEQARVEHASAVEHIRTQHEEALQAKASEVEDLVARLRGEHEGSLNDLRDRLTLERTQTVDKLVAEHEASLASLRDQLSESSAALERSHQEHEESFGKLKAEHEAELRLQVQAANDLLAQTRKEHDSHLMQVHSEHQEILKRRDAEANAVLQRTEEDYYNALTKLRGDHADALEKYAAESTTALERVRDEHAGELRIAEIAREVSLSESQSSRNLALKELQDEHAAAIARKEASFTEEMERLKTDHIRAMATKDGDYELEMNKLRSEYEGLVAKFKEDWRIEVERLNFALAKSKEESRTEAERLNSTLTKTKEESRIEVERLNSALMKTKEESVAASAKVREEIATAVAEARQEVSIASVKAQEEAAAASAKALEEAAVATVKAQEEASATSIRAREESAAAAAKAHEEMTAAIQALQEQQTSLLVEITRGHEEDIARLKTSHEAALAEGNAKAEQQSSLLVESHTMAILDLVNQHEQSLADVNARLVAVHDQHRQDLEASRVQSDQLVVDEKKRLTASLADLERQHSQERETLRNEQDLLLQEIETYKAAADEYTLSREEDRQAHEEVLTQNASVINDMKNQLAAVHDDRDDLSSQVEMLRAELERSRSEQSQLDQEASERESLLDQLEKHRSVLAEMQENLQRVKDEKDNLQVEKNRQEAALRELQAQIARSSSPSGIRPVLDRNMSYTRATGLPTIKLPPPTPPPSVPPPRAPKLVTQGSVDSSVSSPTQTSSVILTTSRESTIESPVTSIGHLSNSSPIDPKITARLEQQAKQLDEQEAMIKTLNKQLTHCESDLQTHIDLVGTLETSLGDAEKNLRKARMQATELARERDTLNSQLEGLRNELQEAKHEVVTVRRSIVEEKHSLEQRLDEERKAKERARQQLDTRMDELQRRKSKFACL